MDSRYNFGGSDWALSIILDMDAAAVDDVIFDLGQSPNTQIKLNIRAGDLRLTYRSDGAGVLTRTFTFVSSNRVNQKTYILMQRAGNALEAYINADLVTTYAGEFTGKTFDMTGLFGTVGISGTSAKVKVSDFILCNSSLTPPEIKALYNHNLVPESTHLNIIKHLPMTEAFAFKADAAFVANHSEFSVGNNVFLDVVEQYNYAKGAPLTPQHAKTVNYADADVGAGGFGPNKTIKDFYTKEIDTSLAYDFTAQADDATITATDNAVTTGQAFSVYVRILKALALSSTNAYFFDGFGNTTTHYWRILNRSSGIEIIGNTFSVRFAFPVPYDTLVKTNLAGVIVMPDFLNASGWYWQDIRGFKVFAIVTTNNFIGGDLLGLLPHTLAGRNGSSAFNSESIISAISVFDGALTSAEIEEVFFKKGYSNSPKVVDIIIGETNSSGDIESKIRTNSYTPISQLPFIDSRSLLPLLEDSFNIDETFSIQAPTSLGDAIADTEVSVMLTIKLPLAALPQAATRYIIRWGSVTVTTLQIDSAGKVQARTGEFVDLFAAGSAETQIFTIFLNNKFVITGSDNCLTWKDAAQVEKTKNLVASDVTGENLTISGIDQDVEIIRCGVWSRLLSIREMLELSDNTLLANPTIEQQVGLEAFYNMNLGSFSENGVNVFLEDHSGNARDAIVAGLTGGSSAAQLADVPNHLSNISTDLR